MQPMPPLILVVDDDPHIRHLLAFALDKAGMRVAEAADGEAAPAAAVPVRPAWTSKLTVVTMSEPASAQLPRTLVRLAIRSIEPWSVAPGVLNSVMSPVPAGMPTAGQAERTVDTPPLESISRLRWHPPTRTSARAAMAKRRRRMAGSLSQGDALENARAFGLPWPP